MTRTFKQYIKYHEPDFRPVTKLAEYYYYCGISCYDCKVNKCTKIGKEPIIHKNNLKEFMKEYPEYFI